LKTKDLCTFGDKEISGNRAHGNKVPPGAATDDGDRAEE
jgi:hypothetical protein